MPLVFMICILVSGNLLAAEPATQPASQGSWWQQSAINPRNWHRNINQRFFEPERMEQADYYAAIHAGAQDRERYLQSLQRPPTMRDLYLQAGTTPTDLYARAQSMPGELLRERQEAQRQAPILQQRLERIQQPGGLTFVQSRDILANRWHQWRNAKSPFMAKTHSYANWEHNSANEAAESLSIQAFSARNPDGIWTQYEMVIRRNKDGSYHVWIDSGEYPVSAADAGIEEAKYRKKARHQIGLTIEKDGGLRSQSTRYYCRRGQGVLPVKDLRLSIEQQAQFVRELLWRAQNNDAPSSAGHNLPKNALSALDVALAKPSKSVALSPQDTMQATQTTLEDEPGDPFVEEMLRHEIKRVLQEMPFVEMLKASEATPERIASLRANVEALRTHGIEYAKLTKEAAKKAHSDPVATERLIKKWTGWIERMADQLARKIDLAVEDHERFDRKNKNL